MFYTNYKKDGNVFSKTANQTNELAWFTIGLQLQLVYNCLSRTELFSADDRLETEQMVRKFPLWKYKVFFI